MQQHNLNSNNFQQIQTNFIFNSLHSTEKTVFTVLETGDKRRITLQNRKVLLSESVICILFKIISPFLPRLIRPGENLKPSCCSALDEDEGFSDWTHRPENRPEGEDGRAAVTRLSKLETEGNQQEDEEEEEEEKGRWRAERRQRSLEASPPEKVPSELRRGAAGSTFTLKPLTLFSLPACSLCSGF